MLVLLLLSSQRAITVVWLAPTAVGCDYSGDVPAWQRRQRQRQRQSGECGLWAVCCVLCVVFGMRGEWS